MTQLRVTTVKGIMCKQEPVAVKVKEKIFSLLHGELSLYHLEVDENSFFLEGWDLIQR